MIQRWSFSMQLLLIIAISLHILAGVFWAGSTFALARTGGLGGESLFRLQRAAMGITVIAGAYLWSQLHAGDFGTSERVLAFGVVCAIIAGIAQGAISGRALRGLRKAENDKTLLWSRFALGQRIGAVLLAITIICMGAARYI